MIQWLRSMLQRTWVCLRCGAVVARGQRLCSLCGTALEFDVEVARWQSGRELTVGDELVVRVLVP